MRKIFFKLIFIFFCNSTFGQTVLPAIISQNTILLKQNSPYVINTSTLVSDNITLTIEAGVDITITGALNVRGIILALGAEGDSIRFHCNNSNAPSIRVIKGINDTLNVFSKFNFCVIRSNNIGIYSFNRKIEVNNSRVSNCLSDGLYIENGALRVNKSRVENNLGGGIFAKTDIYNTIPQAVDSCYVSRSTISSNQGIGIDWGLHGNSGLENSLIYNVSFSENIISDNNKEGIKFYGGGHKVYIYENKFIGNNSFALSLGTSGGLNSPGTFVYNNIFSTNKGVFNTNIPHSTKVWNNIIVDNLTNPYSTKPELFYMKWSTFIFKNNVIAYNKFENLISYPITTGGYDSLSITNNLFYQNKPINNTSSSYLFLLPESNFSQPREWDLFKFTGNNYLMDETSNYWIKNENKVLDFITSSNYKNTVKNNFDGVNGFYGFVYELDPLSSPNVNAPISPVRFAIIDSVGAKFLVWKQNPERDLKGYKIYFGKTSDFEYANTVDVGMKNLYRIPNEHSLVTDFTVTAYDKEADGNKDFFEGHESWYSDAQIGPGIIIKKGTEVLQSPISACPNQTYRLKSVGSCASVIWSNGSTARDLTLSNLTGNSSYYFDCVNNTPITHSFRSETVNFYVNPTQFNHSVVLPDETVQIFNAQKIGSSSVFGSNSDIKMEAGGQVVLEPGFFFNGAKQFTAEIKNCPN